MNRIFSRKCCLGAFLIAGALVIAPCRAQGQPESSSNIECLEHLEIPQYPPLPRQARITGVQTAKVLLSDQAVVQSVENSFRGISIGPENDFKAAVEKALKNSRFSKTCGGKTITLVFQYAIRQNENESLFVFEPPNYFLIRAGPFYVMPERSAK